MVSSSSFAWCEGRSTQSSCRTFIGNADDLDVLDVGVPMQEFLDLARIDVLPPRITMSWMRPTMRQ
jgi:hypothetical protein